MSFATSLREHICAGYQCLMVPTVEETRCETEMVEVAKKLNYGFITWDQINGFSNKSPDDDSNIKNPVLAMLEVARPDAFPKDECVFVFRDMHNFMRDSPDCRRTLRGLFESTKLCYGRLSRPIVFLQPSRYVHPDTASCLATLEFKLPNHGELQSIFTSLLKHASEKNKWNIKESVYDFNLIQSLRGLTSTEAANVVSLCLARYGARIAKEGMFSELLSVIEDAKAATIKNSEILTYIPRKDLPLEGDIGGYEELIAWIKSRGVSYTPQAIELGLDMPKGMCIVGLPGSGKSIVARIIASVLGLPLIVFDFASVFDKHVGESEKRTREVINTVEAHDGCVLLIDEADKALSGSSSSESDGGVGRRVFGQLLEWLARKNDRTFVVMTMNRIKGLPPELLRRGRVDELFYVDMPEDEERQTIFSIHMRKRRINPEIYTVAEWKNFIKLSHEMVGSEIEEAVKSARFMAYSPNKDKEVNAVPTAAELSKALEEVAATKIFLVDGENLRAIRDWGLTKARPVSRKKKAGPRTRKISSIGPETSDN